jgi:hypothetical protein
MLVKGYTYIIVHEVLIVMIQKCYVSQVITENGLIWHSVGCMGTAVSVANYYFYSFIVKNGVCTPVAVRKVYALVFCWVQC